MPARTPARGPLAPIILLTMTDPNIIISIISLLVSIITLYASFYFFNRTLKEKTPLFTLESNQYQGDLIAATPDGVTVYENTEIKRFTVSRIAIWNDGKDTIFRKDISPNDNISIAPEEGYEFYFARLLFTINNSNKCEVVFRNGVAIVDFDYLDFREGSSVEVFHSGKTSWSIKVSGSIIGSGKIKHAPHINYPKRASIAMWLSLLIFVLGASTSLLFGVADYKKLIFINGLIAMISYAFLPMIISYRYYRAKKTSELLGVNDDDAILRAPDFPPTGRVRERNKDADQHWT
jgi:hypothetical protein